MNLSKILLFLLVIAPIFSFGQMQFDNNTMENGLTYPTLKSNLDTSKYKTINSLIYDGVKDLEESAYCIGDFGYAQKGSLIQIQIMCSCMEMQKGELRYFLFNTDSDTTASYSDLFEGKHQDEATKFINDQINSKKSLMLQDCSNEFNQEYYEIDELDIKMNKKGLEIKPKNSTACEKTPIVITWDSLRNFLKYNYL